MNFLKMLWFAHLAFALLLTGGCDSYSSRYGPGPIQVLGNSNELWLFIELDRMVDTGSRHHDAPGGYPVGHMQEIVVLTNSGKVHRQTISRNDAGQDGATFHPMNGKLFRHEGSCYLFQWASRDYRHTIFKWNGSRFEKLPIADNAEFLEKHMLLADLAKAEKLVQTLTIQAGWQLLHSERSVSSEVFNWKNRPVKISAEQKAESFFIKIEANGFEPIVMEYPARITKLSSKEFKALSREEHGYAR